MLVLMVILMMMLVTMMLMMLVIVMMLVMLLVMMMILGILVVLAQKKGDKVSKTADPFKEGQLTLHLTPSVLPHQSGERQARQGIPAQTGVSLKSGLG